MTRALHLAALLGATVLWGSSFTAIKAVMGFINEYRYTWLRGLAPYVLYLAWRNGARSLVLAARGGLAAGVAYTLGIWLQGWGTAYTTASNSAFITGLNVVIVHVYQALIRRSYSLGLGVSLLLSVMGLYLLTGPTGGLGIGELLVLASAFVWAAHVILVSRYSSADPLAFTFFEALVAIVMIVPDAIVHGDPLNIPYEALPYLAYLGLVCTDVAFALQVYGQRGVSPATAAIIFLLEPVFAAVIAHVVLGEVYTALQLVGAVSMLAATVLAVRSELATRSST